MGGFYDQNLNTIEQVRESKTIKRKGKDAQREREGEKQRTEEVEEEEENALVMQRQGSIGKHQAENFYRTLLRLWRVGGN